LHGLDADTIEQFDADAADLNLRGGVINATGPAIKRRSNKRSRIG